MLFHQRMGLFFDSVGLHGFVSFDTHRSLDSLVDFPVQGGADLHRFLPVVTACVASVSNADYIKLCGVAVCLTGADCFEWQATTRAVRWGRPHSFQNKLACP
jgi:hypothetical protein